LFQDKCRILANEPICGNFYRLVLESKSIAAAAVPGQFLNIRVEQGTDFLLRRPLSIHEIKKNSVSIIYKTVGRGTGKLSLKKPKESLDVIGPLGKGYTLSDGKAVLVGGGTGVASLKFLAADLINKQQAAVVVMIGARTREEVLCGNEFSELGCKVEICTEDGTLGFKGMVTSLLKQYLSVMGAHPRVVYACGPMPMLKEVGRLTSHFRIPCEVSLEEHMGCGVGACMGCVVPARNGGYLRVCKDGPVFDAREVAL
jgi:dihydroorotate dehydrogenase electron transfer subunit